MALFLLVGGTLMAGYIGLCLLAVIYNKLRPRTAEEKLWEWRISQLPKERQKSFRKWRARVNSPKPLHSEEDEKYLSRVFQGKLLIDSMNMND